MRPIRLTSIPLALFGATLVFASGAVAQTPTPQPCQAFNPCTPVIGPWATAPSDRNQLFQVQCPTGRTAVSGDAAFPGAIYPVGIVTAGGLGPGGDSLEFAAFPDPVGVTFRPAVGCAPPGAKLAQFGRAAAIRRRFRARVRTARVRPGAEVRVRLACARGTRLVQSGSAVGFYTRRPPPARVVKALEHRHRRHGRATRTVVVAPAGVGDDERVEVQVTAICAPAGDRSAARLQGRATEPCQTVEPCIAVDGPWVTAPSNGLSIYTLSCPAGRFAVGSDAGFRGVIYPVAIETGGGLVAGRVDEFVFGALSLPFSVTYQPAVGCSAPGAALPSLARATAARPRYRVRTRTVRVRPGAAVRVRLGCARGRRLMHSGSGVAFFTRRPPSRQVIRALEHRHRRAGRLTRTLVVAPAGVGNDERVELQVTAICAPGR